MTKTETQTRQDIIDKRLLKAGWNVKDPSQVTEELDIYVGNPVQSNRIQDPARKYGGHLFADYALLGKDGYPLAVVEAKKTSADSRAGKEQARNYAEKIQKNSNRDMPFVFYTNGHDIYFWDTERYPPRKIYGFPTRSDLERTQFLRDNGNPLSDEMIKPDIAGRPYQIQAIRAVLEAVQKKRRKFLLVMATGTGKTRTCIGLIDVLMRANWVQRVLFLVDRIALRNQALSAFKEHLPNAPAWPQQGETSIATDRRVYVSTYPTMLNIIEDDVDALSPHFFDLIVADESHRSIYNVYKHIFDYFDSIQLGLTATPTDKIDHNTFKLFNCEDGLPSFAYTYEEAINNIPPYLSDFEVLRIRTRFQQDGISRKTIPEAEKKRLIAQGKDLDDFNYEGTDLEKRVTNKGTNALIVRQFMEESIKDHNGVLPGKTIFFAITQKHAYRLVEVFDKLYPEYKGRLARVIISGQKGVHGKGGLLDRFKNSDMPRVAVSVDMLDTGIDILELVNLVFAKPVYSYTKFWQMIGRGTRILDPDRMKPWCLEKDKFLIMDCWENFEYFKMNPKGKETKHQAPLPIRLFEARINKLKAALKKNEGTIVGRTIKALKNDLRGLPENSVIVIDGKSDLAKTEDDGFWNMLSDNKIKFLENKIASVMRALSNADFKAMRFELDVTDTATARILGDKDKFEILKAGVIEQVAELPLSVNIVAREKALIEQVIQPPFWNKGDVNALDESLDEVIAKLAPLMRFRQSEPLDEEKIDIQDKLTVKEYIEFGPENERMMVNQYREKVEKMVKALANTNLVLKKLSTGGTLTKKEIETLSDLLEKQDPYVTEEHLQKIYDNKKAKFIQFIKHILGLEKLASFSDTVANAFDEFIAKHNDYTEQQIQFLLTLKTYILRTGDVKKKDLTNAPFTQLHPQGIRGVFRPADIDEILEMTYQLVA
ncbi:MAG: DEAD/DEAH box helicase family protein [Desulfobacterales bacterium]|nr:DEAD/DEAH box helicase family protein [Desulfobacterales bacterium]